MRGDVCDVGLICPWADNAWSCEIGLRVQRREQLHFDKQAVQCLTKYGRYGVRSTMFDYSGSNWESQQGTESSKSVAVE